MNPTEGTTGRTGVLPRLRRPVEVRRPTSIVGGPPQVSLLPPELRDAGAIRQYRRKLIAVVVVAAVVAGAAVAGAASVQSAAEQRLAAASQQGVALTAQVGKFAPIRDLQSRIALAQAGVKVGGSTMIDWKTQIDAIQAVMPAAYSVTTIEASGATPVEAYPQASNLLEPRRAATITMTVLAPSLGNEYSAWLRELRSIPAYADASATFTRGDLGTTIVLTVHLTAAAIDAADPTETP